MSDEVIRVAIIGTGSRGWYMYDPILRGLGESVELVGVWGRGSDSVRSVGERLGVPWYTDMAELMREGRPSVGIVTVGYHGNGTVGLMAVEHGLHVLLETPIAHDPREADAIIESARRQALHVEVAEQFHRRPYQQLVLKLIEEGVFGEVFHSMNDFGGHGYHGVSLLRSCLGFERRPISVTGSVHSYDLAPHYSQNAKKYGPRTEVQEHGIIEFEGGRVGVFHWTSIGYDSALRWWRSSRFYAERGMGVYSGAGMESEPVLSVLSESGGGPQFITVRREYERSDGGALVAVHADIPGKDARTVTWSNPFFRGKGMSPQWHDDDIGVAGCLTSLLAAVRGEGPPSYGAVQAKLDQEVILAIRASAANGGEPVTLPFEPAL